MKEKIKVIEERLCAFCKGAATIIKNKDYTTRELVFAVITIFISGVLLGVLVSPKKSTMLGSNNGNNNVGMGDFCKHDKEEKEEK